MRIKLLLCSLALIFAASTVNAQVIDMRSGTNPQKPTATKGDTPKTASKESPQKGDSSSIASSEINDDSYFYAELVSVETEEGKTVRLEIDEEFRTYFPTREEQKLIGTLGYQQFRAEAQALNFLSMNGWEFVDQYIIQTGRNVERRILVRRPSGLNNYKIPGR